MNETKKFYILDTSAILTYLDEYEMLKMEIEELKKDLE